jgi:hypothetical protein
MGAVRLEGPALSPTLPVMRFAFDTKASMRKQEPISHHD